MEDLEILEDRIRQLDACAPDPPVGELAGATAKLIEARPTAGVFTLGDNSNEIGSASQYMSCYAKTWGGFLNRTRATIGNHDCMTSACAPYYAYFGAAAGPAGKGYYSYNLANNWHVIVLNSQGTEVGGTGAGSPQETWLRVYAHSYDWQFIPVACSTFTDSGTQSTHD